MLNKEQLKAAEPDEGVNLILAGAGTGKTKTLIEKVKNIILHNKKNGSILILTFSRKAALEIKERIDENLTGNKADIITGTFHSFCFGFLKEHEKLFLEKFEFDRFPAILKDEVKEDLLKEIMKNENSDLMGVPGDIILDLLNRGDNLNEETKKKLLESGLLDEINVIKEIFVKIKQERNFIEFEDMIEFTITLLKDIPGLREEVVSRYKYILIDEFQDTSDNNFELISLLLPDHNKSLLAVGDDWQSIYSFRNAKIEYIINLKKYLPEVSIHKLKINYRSRKEIVKISNRFIKNNKFRTRKKLISFKGRGGFINCYVIEDSEIEYNILARIIDKEYLISDDLVVLYRNNWQGDLIKEKLDLNKYSDIQLMTMHASKGLEFNSVIIVGVSDKIIPDRTTSLEDERRLFYVALTRAKEKLVILAHLNKKKESPRFVRELKVKVINIS